MHTYIHGPHLMNCNDVGHPLMFPPASSSGQILKYSKCKYVTGCVRGKNEKDPNVDNHMINT